MEATCEKEKCKKWDKGRCLNYIEAMWSNPMTGEQRLIGDCTPRRTFLMIREIHQRIVGCQQAIEQLRNEATWVQVVAEVLGRNSGVDLAAFVEERRRLNELQGLNKISIGGA